MTNDSDLNRYAVTFGPTDKLIEHPGGLWVRFDDAQKEIERLSALADVQRSIDRNTAYEADIEQLRGNLSLAEEGLANYALEVERLRAIKEPRPELDADSPNGQFAAVLKAFENGEDINAQDLINAQHWRIRNQRRELARKNADITQLRGNLSLAEEGLASAVQEIAKLNDYIKGLPDEPRVEHCPVCLLPVGEHDPRCSALKSLPTQNVGQPALNDTNIDHALNCPCAKCKADPVKQAQLAEMQHAQRTGE